MKTRDEALAEAYPNNITRIRERATESYSADWLKEEADTNAPNLLAAAFDWWRDGVKDGERWNELYERGTDR